MCLSSSSDLRFDMDSWNASPFLVFRNERLFQEMYEAWLTGRSEKDPSEGWYNGEIWFYDNYIIPLAKKLKECGVFGVAGDEYLNYARANRAEWELKGQAVVAKYVKKFSNGKMMDGDDDDDEDYDKMFSESDDSTSEHSIDA